MWIEWVIKGLKDRKAPDCGRVTAAMIKANGQGEVCVPITLQKNMCIVK